MMLSLGCHHKKENTKKLAFVNFTRAFDHLNTKLGHRPRALQKKKGPLIQSLHLLSVRTLEPVNLEGGRQEKKKGREEKRKGLG